MSSLGIRLPLTRDSSDGFTMLKTLRQMTKQNFKMLLLTNPGERIMEPNFGVGMQGFLFEQIGDDTFGNIAKRIQKQVKLFIPAITLQEITFLTSDEDSTLNLKLSSTT